MVPEDEMVVGMIDTRGILNVRSKDMIMVGIEE